MSTVWEAVETLANGNHVAAEWAELCGEQFAPLRGAFLQASSRRASYLPCPSGCGCDHEIFEHEPGQLVATCRCEPRSCDDFSPTIDDAKLFALNQGKLGREVCRAFDGSPKETDLNVPGAKQIGSFGNGSLAMVLVLQTDTGGFTQAVAQLVAQLPERFVVLAPTRRWLNGNAMTWLKTAKAGFFDLESHLVLMESGKLQAQKTGGELFSPFLADQQAKLDEAAAVRICAILQKLKSQRAGIKGPLYDVFVNRVLEGRSVRATASACGCSPAQVHNQTKELEKVFGMSFAELERLAKPVLDQQTTVKGDRYRKRTSGARSEGNDPGDDAGFDKDENDENPEED